MITERLIDDVDPAQRDCRNCNPCKDCVHISLSVAEQRKLIERDHGGPCVRLWLTADEAREITRMGIVDWTIHALPSESAHSHAMWRTKKSIDELQVTNLDVWRVLSGRVLSDYEI